MRGRRADEGLSLVKILQVGGGILLSGLILFFYVWWPIQAERAKFAVQQLEQQLAERKSELNGLKSQYNSMTSLYSLDQWAKSHGPWKSAQTNDVILLKG